jgi:hypothetical protein
MLQAVLRMQLRALGIILRHDGTITCGGDRVGQISGATATVRSDGRGSWFTLHGRRWT